MNSIGKKWFVVMFLGLGLLWSLGCENDDKKDSNDKNSSTNEVAKSSGESDDSGGGGDSVLPGAPGITITGLPAMGESGKVSGSVSGVKPSDYVVAMYICVSGRWWIKPYAGSTIDINGDGNWSASMTTGGSDAYATQVVVYLVPRGTGVPSLLGAGSLPAELAGFPSTSSGR